MSTPATPLYRELREALAAEIAAGVYPVGSRFPTDHELCARFGVSRHTVREALRALQTEGLLVRQPGSGTVVRALEAARNYAQTIESMEELLSYSGDTRLELRSVGFVRLRGELAVELDRREGERWLRLAGVRYLRRNDRPQSWTQVFVAERYEAIRQDLPDGANQVFELLQRRFSVQASAVEQRMSAAAIASDVAELVQAEPGSPALVVRRTYFAEDEPFEISLSVYPADRFTHTAWFRRSGSSNRTVP